MATITLKNVPPELLQQLKDRAAANRRSMNNEIVQRLSESLLDVSRDKQRLIDEARRLRASVQAPLLDDDDLKRMRNEGRL